jgi:hypothetical protein
MIALKKRPKATTCSDHHTISLIAHAEKIVARMLRRRIVKKIEDIPREYQVGFRRGKGNVGANWMLRIISEGTLDVGEELCACFMVWQEAFNRANWTKCMQILKETGIDWRGKNRSASCTWIKMLKYDWTKG